MTREADRAVARLSRSGHSLTISLPKRRPVAPSERHNHAVPWGGPERESANVTSMADETRLERRLDRMLARARTPRGAGVVIATASTSITVAAGLLMTVVDRDNFPTLGSGLWWAVQTVTTVGYGDDVPTNVSGQLLAALVMLLGIGFLTVITAAITSTFVSRSRQTSSAADTRTAEELRQMNERLERIEAALPH
jgi:voltage-gated potassium channel